MALELPTKCCDANGGRIQIRVNGQVYQTRGGVTLRPMLFERTVEANDDGSLAIKTVPREATADIIFAFGCGFPLALFKDCRVDLTILFIDMVETWLMTAATLTGRPEIRSVDGTITGGIFAADNCTNITTGQSG
jgi:hypothetical protein